MNWPEKFLHVYYMQYFCSYVPPYDVTTPWYCWVMFSLWSAVACGDVPESCPLPTVVFVVHWSYLTTEFCHCTYWLVSYLFKTIYSLYLNAFKFWWHPWSCSHKLLQLHVACKFNKYAFYSLSQIINQNTELYGVQWNAIWALEFDSKSSITVFWVELAAT